MKRLSPIDIFNKDFSTSFRGYNTTEVNEFLDLIIKDYEEVLQENESLKQERSEYKSNNIQEISITEEESDVLNEILKRLERLERTVYS